MSTVSATVDSLQKSINGMFRDVHAILADNYEAPATTAPTQLEIQMAEQLKEQAHQMEEMKRMMASFLEAEEKAKKEAEERAAEVEKEKAAAIAKKEAAEKEELRKAEHQRKNTEAKKKMKATTFQELSENGFYRTLGVYGSVKGAEMSNDVMKGIGQENHLWLIFNDHICHYQGKLIPYTGDIGYNPQNPNRLIPLYTLVYGEEPALYK